MSCAADDYVPIDAIAGVCDDVATEGVHDNAQPGVPSAASTSSMGSEGVIRHGPGDDQLTCATELTVTSNLVYLYMYPSMYCCRYLCMYVCMYVCINVM